jgi:hypothetical protein
MGLLSADYDFSCGVPSLEIIERKIRELAEEQLELEGSLEPTPTDEAEARRVTESRSTLLRSNNATFRSSGDRRRGARYLALTVSLPGDEILIMGNHVRLFPVVCAALESLGGRVHVHGRQANKAGRFL